MRNIIEDVPKDVSRISAISVSSVILFPIDHIVSCNRLKEIFWYPIYCFNHISVLKTVVFLDNGLVKYISLAFSHDGIIGPVDVGLQRFLIQCLSCTWRYVKHMSTTKRWGCQFGEYFRTSATNCSKKFTTVGTSPFVEIASITGNKIVFS